ncbi:MAG: hypothetical protein LUH07_12640 [Lachnospiraceae bacterium]|nr:hypothetical protein [Lachnospiraceae bacterium]
MSRSYGRCIGYDDTIALFREVANYISDNDMADDELAEQYTYAMNRLEYERDKSVGAETRKNPKEKRHGYWEECGNCACGISPDYKFCPRCGFRIIR